MRRSTITRLLLPALLLASGCDCGDRPLSMEDEEARLQRRVLQPAPIKARAVPPHNIRSRGIGPYELDMGLTQVLSILPHGPRVEVLAVDDLFHYNLVRTDGDALLIGAPPQGAVSFLAAVGPDVARLETGVGVGATEAQLDEALGEPHRRDSLARDPRVRVYRALPGTRFLVEGGRIRALLVGPAPEVSGAPSAPAAPAAPAGEGEPALAADAGPPPDVGEGRCAAAELYEKRRPEVVVVAGVSVIAPVAYGCFGDTPAAVVTADKGVVLVTGDGDRLRRLAHLDVAGLLYAAPIAADGDGRHDLVTVSRQLSPQQQVVRVEVYRLEGGRLVSLAEGEPFQLTAGAAGWVGARPMDVDFLVELSGAAGGLEVSGLYLQRAGPIIRNLVPLEPRTIPLRRRRSSSGAAEPGGARLDPLPDDAVSPPVDSAAARAADADEDDGAASP